MMSIKTLKIIKYIPFLNFIFIMPSWLYMYKKNHIGTRRFLKNLMIIFALIIIITIPEIIVDRFLDIALVKNIVSYINSYLLMFIPSAIAVYDKKRFLEEEK